MRSSTTGICIQLELYLTDRFTSPVVDPQTKGGSLDAGPALTRFLNSMICLLLERYTRVKRRDRTPQRVQFAGWMSFESPLPQPGEQ